VVEELIEDGDIVRGQENMSDDEQITTGQMALKDPKGSNRDNEGEEIEDIDSDDEIALAYQLEQ